MLYLLKPLQPSCVVCACTQVPTGTVWYGPDTYMGRNLAQLFGMLAELPDEEVGTYDALLPLWALPLTAGVLVGPLVCMTTTLSL